MRKAIILYVMVWTIVWMLIEEIKLSEDAEFHNLIQHLWILLGLYFLCWISGVVPLNTWLISNWEENKCCYKQKSKCYCYSAKYESYQTDCFATSYKSALQIWLFWKDFSKIQSCTTANLLSYPDSFFRGYKASKCTKWHIFHSKWSKLSFCQLLSL